MRFQYSRIYKEIKRPLRDDARGSVAFVVFGLLHFVVEIVVFGARSVLFVDAKHSAVGALAEIETELGHEVKSVFEFFAQKTGLGSVGALV